MVLSVDLVVCNILLISIGNNIQSFDCQLSCDWRALHLISCLLFRCEYLYSTSAGFNIAVHVASLINQNEKGAVMTPAVLMTLLHYLMIYGPFILIKLYIFK